MKIREERRSAQWHDQIVGGQRDRRTGERSWPPCKGILNAATDKQRGHWSDTIWRAITIEDSLIQSAPTVRTLLHYHQLLEKGEKLVRTRQLFTVASVWHRWKWSTGQSCDRPDQRSIGCLAWRTLTMSTRHQRVLDQSTRNLSV